MNPQTLIYGNRKQLKNYNTVNGQDNLLKNFESLGASNSLLYDNIVDI